MLPPFHIDKLDFGPSQVSIGRQNLEERQLCVLNYVGNLLAEDQHVIKAAPETAAIYADAGGSICLGVCVYEEDSGLRDRECGGEVYRSSSFTDSTLLIGYRDYFSHSLVLRRGLKLQA